MLMRATRLKIIDTVLSYLFNKDIDGAIRYLTELRKKVLAEMRRRQERPRRSPVDRCIEIVMRSDESAREHILKLLLESTRDGSR